MIQISTNILPNSVKNLKLGDLSFTVFQSETWRVWLKNLIPKQTENEKLKALRNKIRKKKQIQTEDEKQKKSETKKHK